MDQSWTKTEQNTDRKRTKRKKVLSQTMDQTWTKYRPNMDQAWNKHGTKCNQSKDCCHKIFHWILHGQKLLSKLDHPNHVPSEIMCLVITFRADLLCCCFVTLMFVSCWDIVNTICVLTINCSNTLI